LIKEFFHEFLKKHQTIIDKKHKEKNMALNKYDLYYTENKEYNKENIYPETFVSDISFF